MRALTKISMLLVLTFLLATGCGGGSSEDDPAGSGGAGGSAGGSGSGGDGGAGGDGGPRFSQLTAWGDHSCGLLLDGSVRCWGSDTHAAVEPPANDTFREIHTANTYSCGQGLSPAGTFTQIAAGHYSNCGLREGGTVECWGAGTQNVCSGPNLHCGQATPPEGQTFKTLGLGWLHSCGIRADDSTTCWGFDRLGSGDLDPPSGEVFEQLTAGQNHSCGLRADGVGICWGYVPCGSAGAEACGSG